MALTAEMVTIDCADPRALAGFWEKALDLRVVHDFGGEFLILRGDGALQLGLQKVAEPRLGKNRVHLDLLAHDGDRAGEVNRLLGLGARALEEHEIPGYAWTVVADPDGNEFCVGAPQEQHG
jgi:catechol 2,3-dioxygenase-like lactoylglutathione lyase family enzyme